MVENINSVFYISGLLKKRTGFDDPFIWNPDYDY